MRNSLQHRHGTGPAACVTLGLLACALPAASRAQELRDLVEEVLDQKIENVQIDGLPLPEALARLGEKTGLSFMMDPAAMDCMPYGERTRVSIDLRDVPVRQALQRMFAGLGLVMSVDGDKIRIEAAPALDRLGRRMTIQEVRVLGELSSKSWSELGSTRPAVQFRGITQGNPQQVLEEAMAKVQAASALQQLETATQGLGWCWVPQDNAILVYTRAEDVRQRLDRRVDLDYQQVLLDDVLVDLGNRVGITVSFDPGVLEYIQAQQRKVDLIHRGTTARQALERLCGTADIVFEATDSGVRIGLPKGQAAAGRSGRGRVVAILRVPVGVDGTSVDFPFYEDNLPPEFRGLLDRKLPVIIEELRRGEGR